MSIVSHFGALMTILIAILTVVSVVGGFILHLVRSWWSMQEAIKSALKADTELKNAITQLVENKEAVHREINTKHQALVKRVRELERRQ